ncbi:MAG: TetR/AcrR family transcriptional regulator C-terminal domain-containing protein [Candidatus Limivicinus sp.]
MASTTKDAFAAALKQVMAEKPMNKITVKDLVGICGVNRQTFYYHFSDVYDLLEWVFEEDCNRVLPDTVVYEQWPDYVKRFFDYFYDNREFVLNVFNSNSRLYMLRYLRERLERCLRAFAEIASEGWNIDRLDFDFVLDFYSNGIIGLVSQMFDMGLQLPQEATMDRFLKVLNNSMENMLYRFRNNV